MDLHLLCRVYRWIASLIYALCMAYHPNDGKFLFKRSKDKKKGIRDAWTYGASIVVIYVLLGLAITSYSVQCLKCTFHECYF